MFDFLFNISFEYPYIFILLVLFILCARFCKACFDAYYIPHLDIYSDIVSSKSGINTFLKWTAIVFAIIALASPVKKLNVINTQNDGIDIVMTLDSSGSMRQTGFNKTKIDQNRVVLKEYYYFYPLFISFLALLFFVYDQNKRGV